MTSHYSSSTDRLIAQLKAHALVAVKRQGQPHLDRYIAAGRVSDHVMCAQRDRMHMAESMKVPLEIVDALRSPAGVQQLVHLHVDGRSVRVVINPLGRAAPDRELAVWLQIRTLALGTVAA